ncbi:hypothetical protein [Pseudomonas oryzihabitans]|uniref:hypothetical protein n=1 Tax=Pseudomonas oryzihabitans TaxID=47885 RepID=UPI0011A4B051|nr:hypothetical protein [Pseudomonas psychrotolerans]
MTRTVLKIIQDGVGYFLNTETSSPGTRSGKRYRLFKTANGGKDKLGWVGVGAQAGQELLDTKGRADLVAACERIFASKRPQRYVPRERIRGMPGPWEGEAFPERQEARSKRQNVTCHEGGK